MSDDRSPSGSGPATRPAGRGRPKVTGRAWITAALAALLTAIVVALPASATGTTSGPIYLDTSYTFGERAADLVARLTPAQRASQLVSSQAPQITSVANPLLTASQLGGSTTLAGPASAGDTNLKVASVTNIVAGMPLVVDPGGSQENVTVTTVGTAAATATSLPVPTNAGDTNIKVASVTGMATGHTLRVDTGANVEYSTIQTVGTAAATSTTLSAASAMNAMNIKVASVTGMTVGHQIRVDTGASLEIDTIQTVGTAGGTGTGITLTAPLALAHASGAGAQDLGTGVTLTAGLTLAHAAAAAVQDLGTGLTITPALAGAHALGATVNLMVAIPAYGWWNEALHGVARESTAASGNAVGLTNTTSYPIDQAMASSFDPDLEYRVASQIGDESREVVRGNKLDLDFYSPTMNLQHDPRWGRNDESYGEDPLLETKMVSQFVNGMEGKDQNGQLLPSGGGFYKTTTTLKHYAMNNSEVNRRTGSSDADDRTIREYYTKAFRGVIQASQPGAIMSSYNSINGIPSPANDYLNTTLARQTFGFGGYFTGDCDTVNEINAEHHWQPAGLGHIATVFEQFAYTLGAGEDAECNAGFNGTGNYRGPTAATTSSGGAMNAVGLNITTPTGLDSVNDVDASAERLFTNRMKLGEFDPDSNVPYLTQARSRLTSYGNPTWVNSNTNNAETETAARLALAREAADKSIVLLKNASTTRKDGSTGKLLPIPVPTTGSFKVLVTGFFANNANFYLGGYSSTQGAAGQLNEVTPYIGLKNAIQAINPAAQVDFMKGFTSTGTNANTCCTTVDPAVVAAAPTYDYVVVAADTDPTGGCAGCGTEDQDRTAITFPGQQGQFIDQIAKANPNTVAYMETIGPMDVSSFEPDTSAILWSSYLAQRKGDALADVLLGAYNPSARTSGIWYQNVGQIPAITSYAIRPVGPTGRTYMYYNGPLAYPFGYGLSYSTFSFANLQIDKTTPTADDTVTVSADVTNTSSTDGKEVVELYANTPDADPSLQRPIKRLEGFQNVLIPAGQTKTVTFSLPVSDLAFYDQTAGRWAVDDGRYGLQVSTSSADGDIQLQGFVNVSGTITQKPSVLSARPRIATTDVARGITQRVIFPEGVDVDPGLTVSMNDDTLYGWIDPGQSKPFPSGMTFSYSSDRPDIVSVSGSTIHTVANGAATVTATGTYNGVSTSVSFVVRVVSDLTSLKVNGQALNGFNPDVQSYDVVVPDGVSAIPQVAAGSGDGTVAITQASTLPGTATVTSTGPDGIVATYRVNFAHPSRSDEFDTSTLGSQWHWVRETPADHSLTANPGTMTITSRAGDLTTTTNTAQNLLLQPAPGDWSATTKIVFGSKPAAATQQGGLLAYQDDDNYLKFDLEATSATALQFSTKLEDTLNSNPANATPTVQVQQTLNTTPATSILPANNTIWLRMTKSGYTYSTFYSTDGTTFVPVWTTGATLRNVQAGVFAMNQAGSTALPVSFDFFHITGTGPDATPPPTTTATTAPPVGATGWYTQNPTVTLTAVDNSNWGIASTEYNLDGAGWTTYTAPFQVTGDGIHTLLYRSTDNAGDVESPNTLTLKIDTVKPSTSSALSPAAPTGSNGWYLGPVQVTLTATDATSGVAGTQYAVDGGSWQTYSGPFTISSDGDHAVQFASTDNAGNVEDTQTVHVKVDQNDPVTTATLTPGLHNGWYASPTLTLSATDGSGSGVAHTDYSLDGGPWTVYSGPISGFTTGNHFAQYRSTDNAGRVEATKLIAFKVDAVKPTVTITRPDDGAVYPLDKVVTAVYKCVDRESGMDTCTGTVANGANLDTSTVGDHAFTVTATDLAGNQTVVTHHYQVVYTWNGYFSPITNSGTNTLNLVHAGDLVRLGFSLDGDRGTNVFADGYPTSESITCPSGATPHSVPAAGPGATTGLSFGNASGHYTYGWQTQSGWANTCRRFEIKLNDGTSTVHSADFMFFS